MNQRLVKVIKNPYKVFNWLAAHHLLNWMDDKTYLKLVYRGHFGKKLNLDNPITFNEKLQWLKLYNRKPEYTIMVDKVKAKEYVANIIGEEHIIPTLGVWDDPDDIDFDKLPDQFVLKCNHNSGIGLCICKDKSKLDIEKVKEGLRKGLKEDFYLMGREWPYKNVPRKILAEKYMVDDSGPDLKDYKMMCFNGKVMCTYVCMNRFEEGGLKINFYDRNWKRLPFERSQKPASINDVNIPTGYSKMLELAERLSKNIPFLRTDFYEIGGELFFGEITFYPVSGLEEFSPEKWDENLGKLIVLPEMGGVIIDNENYCLFLHMPFNHPKHLKEDLNDYKIFCFNGKPEIIFVSNDRSKGVCFDYFDMDFNHLPFQQGGPNYQGVIERPKQLEEMRRLAAQLSKGIPHVRVDFYDLNGKVYFGEMTFFDSSGFASFKPDEWDEKLGKLITLPEIWGGI